MKKVHDRLAHGTNAKRANIYGQPRYNFNC